MLSITYSCSDVVAPSTGSLCHYYSVMSNKDFCTFVRSHFLNTPHEVYLIDSINQTKDWTGFKIDVLLSHKWWNCIYTTDTLFITLFGWFEKKGEVNQSAHTKLWYTQNKKTFYFFALCSTTNQYRYHLENHSTSQETTLLAAEFHIAVFFCVESFFFLARGYNFWRRNVVSQVQKSINVRLPREFLFT